MRFLVWLMVGPFSDRSGFMHGNHCCHTQEAQAACCLAFVRETVHDRAEVSLDVPAQAESLRNLVVPRCSETSVGSVCKRRIDLNMSLHVSCAAAQV